MASVSVSRADLFPVGTVVSLYSAAAHPAGGGVDRAPSGSAVTTATVQADGSLTFTGITADLAYVAYAAVGGQHRSLRVRSADSVAALGRGAGTVSTTSGSATASSATASSGSFQIGQRIAGAGIPPQTRIKDISGSTLTLTNKATATASGVSVTVEAGTSWAAKARARRAALGTV